MYQILFAPHNQKIIHIFLNKIIMLTPHIFDGNADM